MVIAITLKNSNCCFSKYFGYYSCITVLSMLIQRMQWTSGNKILSGLVKHKGDANSIRGDALVDFTNSF